MNIPNILILEIRALIDKSKAMAGSCKSAMSGTNPEIRIWSTRVTISLFVISLPLPQFSGDFREWVTFCDRFNALVDGRLSLSKTDKVYYLIGCLQGVAVDSVGSYGFTFGTECCRSVSVMDD